MRRWWLNLIVSGIYTALFFLWWGYSYGDGDQAEHLPWVFKQWNPSLYQGDYFMDYADRARFNVRWAYVRLLTFLANEESLPYVCFLLTVFSTWLGIAGVLAWGRAFFPQAGATGWMAPFFSHFLFYRYWSLGDNLIAETSFISGTLPLAAGFWALAWLARERFGLAALIIALGGVLHIMVGLHLLILFTLFVFFYRPAGRWRTIAGGTLLFVALNFTFFKTLVRELEPQSTFCEGLSYGMYFIRFRLPHHFVMSAFPISHYVKFGVLLSVFFLVSAFSPLNRQLRVWIRVNFAVLLGCLVYYALSEILGFEGIFKTQWPKLTIWLSAGASIALAKELESAWYEKLLIDRSLRFLPAVFFLLLLLKPWLKPVEINWPWQKRSDALAQVHQFIREHTPLEGLFVTDPKNDRFAIEAQRPLLTGYRAVWPEPEWACNWFRGFCRVYKVLPDSLKRFEKLRDLASDHFVRGLWQPWSYDRRASYALVPVGSLTQPVVKEALILYRNEAFAVVHWP